jgi:selenocysteine lyase/cysteine desulfurase
MRTLNEDDLSRLNRSITTLANRLSPLELRAPGISGALSRLAVIEAQLISIEEQLVHQLALDQWLADRLATLEAIEAVTPPDPPLPPHKDTPTIE